MENGMKSTIEGIGTYHLILESGYVLDLYSTLYVPSLSRNLISVSKLDISGLDVRLDLVVLIYIRILIMLVLVF